MKGGATSHIENGRPRRQASQHFRGEVSIVVRGRQFLPTDYLDIDFHGDIESRLALCYLQAKSGSSRHASTISAMGSHKRLTRETTPYFHGLATSLNIGSCRTAVNSW